MSKRKKRTIIHVNQNNIRKNIKKSEDEEYLPVITCKTYNTNEYGFTASIKDSQGNVVAEVVYRPDNPLSCGARVFISTYNEVDVCEELPC